MLADLKEGVSYVKNTKDLRSLILIGFGLQWYIGSIGVVQLFMIESVYQIEMRWFGFLMGAMSFGGILGSLLAVRLFNYSNRVEFRAQVYRVAVLFMFLNSVLMILVDTVYGAVVLVFLQFLCFSVCGFFMLTQIQIKVPENIRARVISILQTGSLILAAGGATAGILIDITDKDMTTVQVIFSALLIILVLPTLMGKSWKTFMSINETGV